MSSDQALEFKGATLQIINALLRSADPAALAEALRRQTGGSTDFFSGEPVVLDFSQAGQLPAAIDWTAILELLRRYQLKPAGVRGAAGDLLAAAEAAGLIELDEAFFGRPGRVLAQPAPPPPPPVVEAPPPPPPVAAPPEPAARTLIIEKPLRSGQQVYARGADLIVLAMVSAGAEVIADGNVHVYAPLRGRALAGASGDKDARVFTTCLEAELVSVAGLYRTFEQGLPRELAGKPAKVGIAEDKAGKLTLEVLPLAVR